MKTLGKTRYAVKAQNERLVDCRCSCPATAASLTKGRGGQINGPPGGFGQPGRTFKLRCTCQEDGRIGHWRTDEILAVMSLYSVEGSRVSCLVAIADDSHN